VGDSVTAKIKKDTPTRKRLGGGLKDLARKKESPHNVRIWLKRNNYIKIPATVILFFFLFF
jgi:hypothetical protein